MSEDPGFSLQVIQCQGQQSKKTQDDRLHQQLLDLSFLSVDKLISANQIGRSSNIFYPQDSFVTKASISNPKWYQRLADQLLDLSSVDHWSLIKLISCYLPPSPLPPLPLSWSAAICWSTRLAAMIISGWLRYNETITQPFRLYWYWQGSRDENLQEKEGEDKGKKKCGMMSHIWGEVRLKSMSNSFRWWRRGYGRRHISGLRER